jgi:hypothetical protein
MELVLVDPADNPSGVAGMRPAADGLLTPPPKKCLRPR